MLNRRIEQTDWKSSAIGLCVIMLSVILFLVALYILIVLVKLLIG
ncbi:hypothetical protein [Curtanaerobium respiraculi]|nr:hypothetical protein [Curtanaerobium respiraculi]